ncbi:MAG TPA: (2Fe-2S)-binding protein [Mycobacterium sp.]|nr:(2Fe-2S)-binding protein [Mycobacterium sp.]
MITGLNLAFHRRSCCLYYRIPADRSAAPAR